MHVNGCGVADPGVGHTAFGDHLQIQAVAVGAGACRGRGIRVAAEYLRHGTQCLGGVGVEVRYRAGGPRLDRVGLGRRVGLTGRRVHPAVSADPAHPVYPQHPTNKNELM